MKKYLEIVEYNTKEVVYSTEVTGKTESELERLERGYNINLNHDKFYTRVREEEKNE